MAALHRTGACPQGRAPAAESEARSEARKTLPQRARATESAKHGVRAFNGLEEDASARRQRRDRRACAGCKEGVRARETWANVDPRPEAERDVSTASSGRHRSEDDVHGGHVGDAPQREVALPAAEAAGPLAKKELAVQDQVMIRSELAGNATFTTFR